MTAKAKKARAKGAAAVWEIDRFDRFVRKAMYFFY